MNKVPLDSNDPPNEDGHEARIVRLEVQMEYVIVTLQSLERRMEEGFARIDRRFTELEALFRTELQNNRQEWREELAKVYQLIHDINERWEVRWREERNIRDQEMREMRTHMRWMFGVLCTNLAAVIGILAKLANLY